MTKVLIVSLGLAGGSGPDPTCGQYLKGYDPESYGGRGCVKWTANPDKALRFSGPAEALALWKASPKNHPIRMSDGKPNRPLTAYSVTFISEPGGNPATQEEAHMAEVDETKPAVAPEDTDGHDSAEGDAPGADTVADDAAED